MNPEHIRELLEREPFEPLRIRLSSGDSCDVHNPHLVVILKSRLLVAMPAEDRFVTIPLLHIAAIETLQAA